MSSFNLSHYPETNISRFHEFQAPKLVAILNITAIVTVLLATCFNIFILTTFAKFPKLLTPFTIHTVNLIIIDILGSLIYAPIHGLRSINRDLFRVTPLCSAHNYLHWVFPALALSQHAIICLDRWLALVAPVYYRQRKTVTSGIVATLCAVVYINAWLLPVFIADYYHEKPPGEYCDNMRTWPLYRTVVRITTAFIPQGIMYFSYPVLTWLISKRRSKVATLQPTNVMTAVERTVVEQPEIQERKSTLARATSPTQWKKGTRLVLWLIVAQFVLWAPTNITSLMTGNGVQLMYLNDLNSISHCLGGLLMIADVIITLKFLPNLRKAVADHFRQIFRR
ncbi:hypothetical protein RvY_06290 [Ramazzottius varieornatus]|uniref:G-protein coupled receptors family 1 profile domain-containing protein n=1 Tax=Ramazzottius varieornatus TaxID=947166 RepID=A0A1D1UY07_RAMVA|nr:hypothetical protein RvY_06290 [Ramazzottius varieornatus]